MTTKIGQKRTEHRKPLRRTTPLKRKPTRFKIHVNPIDTIFSDVIIARAKGKCEICGLTQASDCCHFIGRANHQTRWELDNACAGCRPCHEQLDAHPKNKRAFFLTRLGAERYFALLEKARQSAKIDREAVKIYLTAELKRLDK